MDTYQLIQIARQLDRVLDEIRNTKDIIITHVKNFNYEKEQISSLEGQVLKLEHDKEELEKKAKELLGGD